MQTAKYFQAEKEKKDNHSFNLQPSLPLPKPVTIHCIGAKEIADSNQMKKMQTHVAI